MDRLDALRLFVRAAETGSFSKAAAEVGVGQPVASRTISALEDRYRVRLFNRTTRSLSLTEAGRSALDHARTVLEAADLLESAVRGVDREPVGLLRVSASIAFTRAELAAIVPSFLQAFPHVRLDLVGRDDRVDLVAEGVDLALRLGPLEDSSLFARRLGTYPRIMVASPELLARTGVPQTPEDLMTMPCIVFTSTPYGAVWPLLRGSERQDIEIAGPVRSSNGEVVRDFACLSLGVAFAPDFLWKEPLADGRLVRVLPDWAGPELALHALWSGRDLARKARVFLEHIAPQLALSQH